VADFKEDEFSIKTAGIGVIKVKNLKLLYFKK